MCYNNEMIAELAAPYGITITQTQNELFLRYIELLAEYNGKFNLTAIKNINDVAEKHFLDSLLPLKNIWQPKNGEKVVDIGTGAGFPGAVFAIIFPETDFYLLDSVNKKVLFLQVLKEELGLTNIYPVCARTEDFAVTMRETFDVVTARAVAHLGLLMEYSFPLLKVNGRLLAMKGPSLDGEIAQSALAFSELSGKIEKIDVLELPTAGFRHNILIKKTGMTAKKYPRDPGLSKRNPLFFVG